MRALLIATYEMGRQPFGLASPAAWLRRRGFEVRAQDLARERLDEAAVVAADLVAWHLPMHTATRLAVPVIERVRRLNPGAHLCAYGVYAPLSSERLRALGIETLLGGEFEADLVALAEHLAGSADTPPSAAQAPAPRILPRLQFVTPDRTGLPPLDRYAAVQLSDGTRRVAGYTEASRGCKHHCRHCPIVPVYDGQFRVVQPDVVLADIGAQVAAGARHITFGDADFFNGIGHAVTVVRRLAAEFPGVSYDVTIKVEHLLRHRDAVPILRQTGCLFVTSAFESADDRVLRLLDKGHSRADLEAVVALMRRERLPLQPTFVAFTPWTTRQAYLGLLQTIDALDLVAAVAPIQLALRLLLPEGSRLLSLPDVGARLDGFDAASLTWRWRHADPGVDDLQRRVLGIVAHELDTPRDRVFESVYAAARETAGEPVVPPPATPRAARATVPYLTEPWYC